MCLFSLSKIVDSFKTNHVYYFYIIFFTQMKKIRDSSLKIRYGRVTGNKKIKILNHFCLYEYYETGCQLCYTFSFVTNDISYFIKQMTPLILIAKKLNNSLVAILEMNQTLVVVIYSVIRQYDKFLFNFWSSSPSG